MRSAQIMGLKLLHIFMIHGYTGFEFLRLIFVSNNTLFDLTAEFMIFLNRILGQRSSVESPHRSSTCQLISSLRWASRLLAHWLSKQRLAFKSLLSV